MEMPATPLRCTPDEFLIFYFFINIYGLDTHPYL